MSETKQFTLAEVKEHITNKSAYFVIHNNVYDVTEFLNEVMTYIWAPLIYIL